MFGNIGIIFAILVIGLLGFVVQKQPVRTYQGTILH